ncbi:MAG: GNAT family N-acetyltransferase [Butyrivibrio sp.]|nr:GNAT family N-acetyltransferase [Acetatifactor muris]MCM1560091.1 GNAT family N-acetyltransferase [Butyrivibrio sp.]
MKEAAENGMEIKEICEAGRKREIAREILEALPEWFGIPEARETYIEESGEQIFFGAMESGNPRGFLCLKETGRDTVELAVMGVRKELHRRGIGRRLFEAAKERASQAGYSFLQVKTVAMGHYPEYDATNQFYLSLGFREFEVFPTLWDECNPCQIYVMTLGKM